MRTFYRIITGCFISSGLSLLYSSVMELSLLYSSAEAILGSILISGGIMSLMFYLEELSGKKDK